MEEPRDDILFILETHTLEPILPTIKSRCWNISFNPLSLENVKKFIRNKFGGKLPDKVIDSYVSKFNGENLAEIIEQLDELISMDIDELTNDESENKEFNFIDFFRLIYLSNFYKAMNYLDDFDIFSDRKLAVQFLQDLNKFCYLVIKTKISEEDKNPGLIKLANVIDKDSFNKIIEFLGSAQNYIENYVNINLIFIQLMLLIKNSFKKQ